MDRYNKSLAGSAVQDIITDHIVFRGEYQTLPMTLYGLKLDEIELPSRPTTKRASRPEDRKFQGNAWREHRQYHLRDRIRVSDCLESLDNVCSWSRSSLPQQDSIETLQDGQTAVINAINAFIKYHESNEDPTSLASIEKLFPDVKIFDTLSDYAKEIWKVCEANTRSPQHPLESANAGIIHSSALDIVIWLLRSIHITDSEDIKLSELCFKMCEAGLNMLLTILHHNSEAAKDFIMAGGLDILSALCTSLQVIPISFLKSLIACCVMLIHGAGSLACECIYGWQKPDALPKTNVAAEQIKDSKKNEKIKKGSKQKRSQIQWKGDDIESRSERQDEVQGKRGKAQAQLAQEDHASKRAKRDSGKTRDEATTETKWLQKSDDALLHEFGGDSQTIRLYEVLLPLYNERQPSDVLQVSEFFFRHMHVYREISVAVRCCNEIGKLNCKPANAAMIRQTSARLLESLLFVASNISSKSSDVLAMFDRIYEQEYKETYFPALDSLFVTYIESKDLLMELFQVMAALERDEECKDGIFDLISRENMYRGIVAVFDSLLKYISSWKLFFSEAFLGKVGAFSDTQGRSRPGAGFWELHMFAKTLKTLQLIPTAIESVDTMITSDIGSLKYKHAVEDALFLLSDTACRKQILLYCGVRLEDLSPKVSESMALVLKILKYCSGTQEADEYEGYIKAIENFGTLKQTVDFFAHVLKSEVLSVTFNLHHVAPELYERFAGDIEDVGINVPASIFPHLKFFRHTIGSLSAFHHIKRIGIHGIHSMIDKIVPRLCVRSNRKSLIDESEYFDVLVAIFFGSDLAVEMPWDEIRIILDDHKTLGQLMTSLHILKLWMLSSEEASNRMVSTHGFDLMIRVLVFATEIFTAAEADKLWYIRIGAAIDPAVSGAMKEWCFDFLLLATSSIQVFLNSIKNTSAYLSSAHMVQALLKCHAIVNLHQQRWSKGGLEAAKQLQLSKIELINRNLVSAIRCWISSSWEPQIIPCTLTGSLAAPLPDNVDCNVAFAPAQLLTVCMLLGDLFPPEWPQSKGSNILTAEDKQFRAALTEVCTFSHLF